MCPVRAQNRPEPGTRCAIASLDGPKWTGWIGSSDEPSVPIGRACRTIEAYEALGAAKGKFAGAVLCMSLRHTESDENGLAEKLGTTNFVDRPVGMLHEVELVIDDAAVGRRYLEVDLSDVQREFQLAQLHPRHLAPEPKTSPATPAAPNLSGLLDSIQVAQHVLEMFRRTLPEGAHRRLLDRLANRLTKIASEARTIDHQ